MENKQIYTSRDLPLVATLVVLKFPILGIDFQIEGARQKPVGYWNFEKTKNLDETVNKVYQKKLSVEPMEFALTMRNLLSQLNNQYKSPRSEWNQ